MRIFTVWLAPAPAIGWNHKLQPSHNTFVHFSLTFSHCTISLILGRVVYVPLFVNRKIYTGIFYILVFRSLPVQCISVYSENPYINK